MRHTKNEGYSSGATAQTNNASIWHKRHNEPSTSSNHGTASFPKTNNYFPSKNSVNASTFEKPKACKFCFSATHSMSR